MYCPQKLELALTMSPSGTMILPMVVAAGSGMGDVIQVYLINKIWGSNKVVKLLIQLNFVVAICVERWLILFLLIEHLFGVAVKSNPCLIKLLFNKLLF